MVIDDGAGVGAGDGAGDECDGGGVVVVAMSCVILFPYHFLYCSV